jgi:hypothetical protein
VDSTSPWTPQYWAQTYPHVIYNRAPAELSYSYKSFASAFALGVVRMALKEDRVQHNMLVGTDQAVC